MVNKIMNITENDPMYEEVIKGIDSVTDDDLVIVARSYKNRKDDVIAPIEIKNGIYFYLAYDLEDKTVYLNKSTPEQIYKAKANMVRKARLGTIINIMFSEGETLDEFRFNGDPMNIATMKNKMHGAGLLYCEEFIKAIQKKIGDFYILPSSIHKLIFVPIDAIDKEHLTEMVRDVNATQVSENEYLADRAFEISEWI